MMTSCISMKIEVDGTGSIYWVAQELDQLREQLKINLQVTVRNYPEYYTLTIYSNDDLEIIQQKLLDGKDE